MTKCSIKDVHPYKCPDGVKAKYVVMSCDIFFHRLFRKCVNIQLQMFRCPVKRSKYIYLNNFTIFVDTVFRMLALFKKDLNFLHNKFEFDKLILIDDIKDIPKKWKMYDELDHHNLSDDYLFKGAIHKLQTLSRMLNESEMQDFDVWEEYLSQTYKGDYHFSLHFPNYTMCNEGMKRKLIRRFVHLISLTQMQLSQAEIESAWRYVLDVMNRCSNVSVYKCKNNKFDYDIVHIFNDQKVVFITKECVFVDNVFYYDFTKLYYPAISWRKPRYEPDTNAKLIRYEPTNRRLISYFDDCQKECHGCIMDINDYMTTEIFRDLNNTYIKNIVTVVQPDKFSETEYSWVTVDMYRDLLVRTIDTFNKLFNLKLI